ncbi:MAG: glucan biosynthesis protein [Hyphomonadaceae bacterium]
MHRRQFLCAAAAAAFAPEAARAAPSAPAFAIGAVRRIAQAAARAPYVPPPSALPPSLAGAQYDAYRAIRFRSDHALWAQENLGFRAEFFHRGWVYKDAVTLFELRDGRARPIVYSPDQFTFDDPALAGLPRGLGYAGFRLHASGAPGLDEFAVFQGASYFRSLGANQNYGLSARGLTLKTADPAGEEFPVFRTFWIERPAKGAASVRVYALLDSPSVAGAFQFDITPGATTAFDIDATLYPRVDLDKAGLAPLTSMYLFSAADRGGFDDFRGAVHDSDGLEIANGAGERLWRPLTNPRAIEESAFQDTGPRGYGLMQRARDVAAFQDYEARYERRPSAWVAPAADWGAGGVHLVELPSDTEAFDNIVSFWRPAAPLRAGGRYHYRYRLAWGGAEVGAAPAFRVADTRAGAVKDSRDRLFAVDFAGVDTTDMRRLAPQLSASAGAAGPVRLEPLDGHGVRAAFQVDPAGAATVELRLALLREGAAASEVWEFRWTP